MQQVGKQSLSVWSVTQDINTVDPLINAAAKLAPDSLVLVKEVIKISLGHRIPSSPGLSGDVAETPLVTVWRKTSFVFVTSP